MGGGLYTYRYTVTTTENDFCIKMGSDESQSHKAVSTNHNLFEEKGELKRNRAEALLLTSLTPYS